MQPLRRHTGGDGVYTVGEMNIIIQLSEVSKVEGYKFMVASLPGYMVVRY